MSTNPLRANLNRAKQIKSQKGDLKQSVSLFDIDYAIMSYLEDTVLPELDDNGKALKIPVIYGNSERWNGARRQGVYRDTHGKLQLPLMMLRRTSVAKNESMPMLNRHTSYQGVTKYSKNNRYDRFTLLGKTISPKYEIYNITMPDYVEINYECMGWTNYTEHLNTVIESLTFASDEYWGDKQKFKFNTTISDYNVVNEVGEGTERINRVEFTLNVKAYLLPEKFDGENTTKKSMSIKRVVVTTETDVTGNGRLEGLLTTPSPYYDNKDLIDFLSLNNSMTGSITTPNSASFNNIKLIQAPPQLASVVTAGITYSGNQYDVKTYINGVRYYWNTHITGSVNSTSLSLQFLTGSLGFSVTNTDEVTIIGKFIDIV
jgi:hypothetical protein